MCNMWRSHPITEILILTVCVQKPAAICDIRLRSECNYLQFLSTKPAASFLFSICIKQMSYSHTMEASAALTALPSIVLMSSVASVNCGVYCAAVEAGESSTSQPSMQVSANQTVATQLVHGGGTVTQLSSSSFLVCVPSGKELDWLLIRVTRKTSETPTSDASLWDISKKLHLQVGFCQFSFQVAGEAAVVLRYPWGPFGSTCWDPDKLRSTSVQWNTPPVQGGVKVKASRVS